MIYSMSKITPLHFYQYLKCPSWVWLDAYGDAEKRRRVHPLSEKLWRQGLIHDTAVIPNKQFVTVHEDDIDEAETHTLELMREGTHTIYRGVLSNGNWVARPDILERVEGKSSFGKYYYVACDVKRTRALEEVHRFQGVFYAELLEKIQGVRPVQGYVLTPDGTTLSFLVEETRARFHLVLREIERILNGEKPAPFVGSGCRESPWLHECIATAESCDDVSLISHLMPDERDALIEAGVPTVHAFAESDPASIHISGIGAKRVAHLQRQAKVLVDKKPLLVEPQKFPHAPIELYLDIETDPLRDAEYLFGVLIVKDGREEYLSFFADRPELEREAWSSFVNCIAGYKGAPIYHFGSYEVMVIRRLAEKYGHALENFEHTIDLGRLVQQVAVFPVYFYSLKDIAKTLGFSWRHPDASGLNSIFWYHKWIETGSRTVRQDIIDYNEDDVRATLLLKQWLEPV